MHHDHKLAGHLAAHLWPYSHASISALARDIDVDRATVARMIAGSPGTKTPTLRRMERALDLPAYTFDLVKQHDLPALREAGLDAGVLAWLRERIDGPDQPRHNNTATGS